MSLQSNSKSFRGHLNLALSAVAIAAGVVFSNPSFAAQDLSFDNAAWAEAQALDFQNLRTELPTEDESLALDKASLDDIYADFSKTADAAARGHGGPGHGGGHGPGHGPGWGPGPGPGGPGWGPDHGGGSSWRDRVQCKARNSRGLVFYGQGRNMPEARDEALRNCYRSSRNCWMDGCQRI